MIKLRFASMENSDSDKELSIIQGEKLTDAVMRSLEGVNLGDREAKEIFHVAVNGHIIEPDFWEFTSLSTTDFVLIAPIIKGGEGGFRQMLMLGIAVAISVYLPGSTALLAPGSFAAGLAVAGATLVAGLLINALIPVPEIKGPQENETYEKSQMYAFSGQSNNVAKYSTVPRVYGAHRIFPNVAANPYTELEVNPNITIDPIEKTKSHELVQYLYAIYDLGLGPMSVSDIKIGDTPITSFDDYEYNLVDLNKPAVSEGPWDDITIPDFTYYKGDHEGTNVSVQLDGNENVGGDPSGYQAVRTSAPNSEGLPQTITLNFVNPQGLFSFSTNGTMNERIIDLNISFRRVGTSSWRSYNDINYVSDYESVGGYVDATFYAEPMPVWVRDSFDPPGIMTAAPYATFPYNYKNRGWDRTYYGYHGKMVNLYVKKDPRILVNDLVKIGGVHNGRVLKITDFVQNGVTYSQLNIYNSSGGNLFGTIWMVDHKSGVVTQQNKILIYNNTTARARIQRKEQAAVYSTFKFTPKDPGQYEIRVVRKSTLGVTGTQRADALLWQSVITRFDSSPITTDKRHTFLELRIRATNQLSGSISNLSAVCNSIVDVWDGTQWVKEPSANPAWIFVDLLTGQVNKRAIDKSRLHMPSIIEWANYCDEVPDSPAAITFSYPRASANFILDYETTLQGVLNQVTGIGKANLNIIDGKYGVLIDTYTDTPVQVFTPRNSRDFSSTRSYTKKPHGLVVKFIEPEGKWEAGEITVYDNGYDATNATELEEVSAFGCTNQEQAWRFGRYLLAQNRLRQETMSLSVDFEHMVCTRGDYVQITQDVMRVGGTPARVKSVFGNTVVIDDKIESIPGLDYGYVFRSVSGQIKTDTLIILDSDTFALEGEMPEPGDLIIIGEVGSVVYDCIVKSIAPNDDMSATLVLVEKNDAIHESESSDVFPEYTPNISNTTDPNLAPPNEVEDLVIIDAGYECAPGGYLYYVTLDWDAPVGSTYEYFQIYVDDGRGYNEVARTRDAIYKYTVSESRLGNEHSFKVIAVSPSGKKLNLIDVGEVTSTPTKKTSLPANVVALNSNITGEVLQLSWERIEDCDAAEYLIRYSPSLNGTWESSIPLVRADRNLSSISVQARTGIYLIKAVDYNGNESAIYASAITTIPKLFNLNVIEEITDFPELGGSLDRVTVLGDDSLVLRNQVIGNVETSEYYVEGFYYYKDVLDLSEIYSVRLQSLIQAEGYTASDLMENWLTLDAVPFLAIAGSSDWDVEAQYRASDTRNVIEDWVSLSSITAMSAGVETNYSEWRPFIMSDVTGRVFQFRLRLISNRSNVTPRVFDGTIRADMPDRIESYNNLLATDTGYELVYEPAFAGPGTSPNVQISIDDAESGDYWEFEEKTLEGFKIHFYDKNDVEVARQFDVVAKGYGRRAMAVI